MKTILPYYYVDSDISILGCTIKKGLQYFVSFIKYKGWVVIKEDKNEMTFRGKYANVDGCTMKIRYTMYQEIAEVKIDFPSAPSHKEEVYKNLVDALNEKYGKGESRTSRVFYEGDKDYDYDSRTTWNFPKVDRNLKQGFYSTGNNSIYIYFIAAKFKLTNPLSDKLTIYFTDRAKWEKVELEEQEANKIKARGFSQTDI